MDLAEAVANSHLSHVRRLVEEEGCAVDAHGADGLTPLCVASIWGNDDIVAYLLGQGADPNKANQHTGWTPMHAASFQEHGPIVRRLIAANANLRAQDRSMRTPIDFASVSYVHAT